MNSSRIAAKTRDQLGRFLGNVFPHFTKPARKFLWQMLFGIQASGDVKLSSVVRMLDEDVTPKKTEDRLSRNLASEGLAEEVSAAVLADAARHVRRDTLILVDPTEIQKRNAFRMEYLTLVRDASRSSKEGRDVLVNGYHACMAVACRRGSRTTVPLAFGLWSTRAPGHASENQEVLGMLEDIRLATGGRGVYVYDRGGDRPAFYDWFLANGLDFVVRMSPRLLESWRGTRDSRWLVSQCPVAHRHHWTFDSHGREAKVQIGFGHVPVRLPGHPERQLNLVVVRGFGNDPMALLTTLPVDASFASAFRVVEAYLSRWRVEETIRFVKQAYRLEDVRVMGYTSLRNMAAVVLATAYFATAWLGRRIRMEVLVEHLERLGKRLKEVPEMFFYALADGIRRAFARHGAGRIDVAAAPERDVDALVQFLPGFEDLAGG